MVDVDARTLGQRLRAALYCRKGHVHPWVHWYTPTWLREPVHCPRCGTEVRPQVDMSGHP